MRTQLVLPVQKECSWGGRIAALTYWKTSRPAERERVNAALGTTDLERLARALHTTSQARGLVSVSGRAANRRDTGADANTVGEWVLPGPYRNADSNSP